MAVLEIVRLDKLNIEVWPGTYLAARDLYHRVKEPANTNASDSVISCLQTQIFSDFDVRSGNGIFKHFRPDTVEFGHKARILDAGAKGNFVL